MSQPTHTIKALGEVSIRVTNLDFMSRFYEAALGLEVLRREESFVFYKIAAGFAGHPQIFALFDASNRGFIETKSEQLSPEHSTLHHVAFNIALEDFEAEKKHLEGLGIKVVATLHEWLHVRSQYFPDPEGNLIELVCYDKNVA